MNVKFRFIISEIFEAVVKASKIVNLYVSSFKERLLFTPNFVLLNFNTTLTFQIKVYRGWGGLLLNIPNSNVERFGCCPTGMLLTLWLSTDITDLEKPRQ